MLQVDSVFRGRDTIAPCRSLFCEELVRGATSCAISILNGIDKYERSLLSGKVWVQAAGPFNFVPCHEGIHLWLAATSAGRPHFLNLMAGAS
jgi:hypothetical protein